MASTPYVINQSQARELLAQVDVPQILRKLFRDLAAGQAVQPAQQLVEFPRGAGDFINYLGVLAEEGVYGVKTSPYIVGEQFTTADIGIYWALFIARFLKAIDFNEMRNVAAYMARIEERPAVKKAMSFPPDYVREPPGSVPTPARQRKHA